MLVQEKMKTYGAKVLTDSELLSLIIGNIAGRKGKGAVEMADKVMESLPQQKLYYLGDSMKSVLLQMKESIEQLTEQNDEQQLLTLHAFTASIPVL